MCQAIIYLRVSTIGQATDGMGLEAQEDACRAYAARLGLPVGGVYTDAGVSGATEPHKRAGLMDAIASLESGDILLVAKRDRLARDVMGSLLLQNMVAKTSASIVSAAGEASDDNTPTGQFIRTILDAVSEYERALIAARLQAGKRAKRSRGLRADRVLPIGLTTDDTGLKAVKDATEADAIAKMVALRADGLSLREISETLAEQGIFSRNGKPFHAKVVRSILARQS